MAQPSYGAKAHWVLGRRYGVPAGMVARATERRLAGDWRGAGAAALVDISIDLDHVRAEHGRELAAALEDDLTYFAPDLLRWHLPRTSPSGLLWPIDPYVVLAHYDGRRLLLAARLPRLGQPQRIVLRLTGPDTDDYPSHDWAHARFAWDVRAAPLLLARMGGGDRTPFFGRDGHRWRRPGVGDDPVALMERVLLLLEAGETERAWTVGGVHVDPGFADERRDNGDRPLPTPLALEAMVPAVARAAGAVLQAQPEPSQLVLAASYTLDRTEVAVRIEDGRLRAERISQLEARRLPRLAEVQWHRMPDLTLLRAGQIDGEHLHPLVRAALFPDQPDPGYRPLAGAVGDSTVDGEPGGDMRVRCGEVWHRIGWRGGRLVAVEHPPDDLRRERTIGALGAQVRGCAKVVSWADSTDHRRPIRPLRRLFRHALLAARHGDGDELARLLDLGIDVTTIHDRNGATLLHHLAKVDGGTNGHPATAVALLLLDRLLAAGLDANALVLGHGTPLVYMRKDGASAALLQAMLSASTRPDE
jgi:hypothetical protein